eukprot:COSAG06_NODE_2192_length_7379_cov_804.628159_7_plen_288_part_00
MLNGSDIDQDGDDPFASSPKKKKKDAGPVKSHKELSKLRKAKEEAERRAALKAQRMILAKRAGRGVNTASDNKQATLGIMEQDEDGRMVERRRDPSDNELYCFESFAEVYGEQAKQLWHTAGLMMQEERTKEETYERGGSDEDDILDGLHDDFGDASGSGGGDPGSVKGTDAGGLDGSLRHELVSKTEWDLAAEKYADKFEQLIVSDNFASFLAKFTAQMMQDSKPEQVQELLSSVTRLQNAQSKQKKLGGKGGKKALRKDTAADAAAAKGDGMQRGGFIEDMGAFM